MKKYGINTKLRKKRLQAIFDKGLCRHNDKIIEAGKGTLIPLRRPLNTEGLTVDQFCQGCYVFVDKNFVETHKMSCRGQSVETMDKQVEWVFLLQKKWLFMHGEIYISYAVSLKYLYSYGKKKLTLE